MEPFATIGPVTIYHGDALDVLVGLPGGSVDLSFWSPPYEKARTYGIGFDRAGQAWVDWMIPYCEEAARVTQGLVAIVCEGQTRQYRYSCTPFLLMADLHRAGFKLRKPPVYQRVGIPGSGGPDWLRNDWEPVICFSRGKLPWSDNTAMGHPPKYRPGGNPSHQTQEGRVQKKEYKPPAKANPGNIIRCHGGGGHLGSRLAHENEAPFPEALAEFFVRSFCPPGGTVLDLMAGSGTTGAAAVSAGRRAILCDIRESQCELMVRRITEALTCKDTSNDPVGTAQ